MELNLTITSMVKLGGSTIVMQRSECELREGGIP